MDDTLNPFLRPMTSLVNFKPGPTTPPVSNTIDTPVVWCEYEKVKGKTCHGRSVQVY